MSVPAKCALRLKWSRTLLKRSEYRDIVHMLLQGWLNDTIVYSSLAVTDSAGDEVCPPFFCHLAIMSSDKTHASYPEHSFSGPRSQLNAHMLFHPNALHLHCHLIYGFSDISACQNGDHWRRICVDRRTRLATTYDSSDSHGGWGMCVASMDGDSLNPSQLAVAAACLGLEENEALYVHNVANAEFIS